MFEHFEILKKYAEELGYKVVFTDCDSWHYGTKIICNNARRKIGNRIIYLSHEIGHAYLFECQRKDYFELFPMFLKVSKRNKIAEIEQEILAWNEGLKIMKNFHIPVNLKNFTKIKTECLRGYL